MRSVARYDFTFKLWEALQVKLNIRLKDAILLPLDFKHIMILGGSVAQSALSLKTFPNRNAVVLDLNAKAI